jgi:hypothetical protein
VLFAAGVVLFFTAFFAFFTCFLATGAELSVVVAGAVCAAKPTVAKVRESPITAEVMVFIVVCPVLFKRRFVSASKPIDGPTINPL